MRTDLLRGMLTPAMLLMAFVVTPLEPVMASAPATTVSGNLWVDAQAGNDANSGVSATSAFKTIQAAARIAGPGTTVHILPGVYRESVIPAADGAASAPVTFLAQNGLGTAKVRGSLASSSLSWTRLASNTIGLPSGVNPANIYYANLSSWGIAQPPRFLVQLDSQGNISSRLMPAREPDWQVRTEWKTSELWWLANGGSSVAACDPVTNSDHQCDSPSRSFTQLTDTTSDSAPAGVEPGNLKTLGNLTGATLVALDARHAHYVYRSVITAHDAASGRITVADNSDDDGNPGLGWGSKYYVENHPALLDHPGEWSFDISTGYLYLWAPNGANPAQLNLEISRLNTGFDLTGRSYITLDGLTIELFNDQAFTISNSNATYKAFGNAIRNSALRYANNGVVLYQYMNDRTPSTYAVDGFTLADSDVGYMDTAAINSSYWWSGAPSPSYFNHSGVRNTVFQNNHLHHLGFNSEERSAVGVRFDFPDRLRFVGNHIDHVAHLGAYFYQSLINSTRQWGLSPSEILLGDILVADNTIEQACMLGSDCGALKFGGRQRPDTHVFRNALITGNVFRNNTGWSYVSSLRYANQVGDANGFYLDFASGVHLYRNIAYNNTGAGFKLSCLWRDGDAVFYNNIAANNYVFGFKLTGTGACDNHNGSVNTQLVNNILVNNDGFGMRIEGSYNTGNFGNLVIDHNLYYLDGWNSEAGWGNPADIQMFLGTLGGQYFHTLREIQAGTPWEDHGVEGDPAFVAFNPADHNRYDGSWPDFHLTSSSTNAINRGSASLPASLSNLLSSFDMADSASGSAFDIGAYETQLVSWVGGVSVIADSNVAVIGRPHIGAQVMAYDGFTAGNTTMYVPMLFHTAWGAYDSALYVQNVDSANTADISIKYYDTSGNLTCTHPDTIPPLSSHGYWIPSECVPRGWVGAAVVTSSRNIVAIGRPHIGSEITTYNGFASGSLSMYVPMLFNHAYGGGYDAALYVQNVDDTDTADITITYYDTSGNLTCTHDDSIPKLSSHGYWIPSECVPPGWVGGATITSNRNIVAIGRPHIGSQVTAYDGFAAGATSAYVPMMYSNADGGTRNAALYVQNVDPQNDAHITLNFYDMTGQLTCSETGTPGTTIGPGSSRGYWLASDSCVPDGWTGGVVITSDRSVVAIGRPHFGSEVFAYSGFRGGAAAAYVPMLFANMWGSYNAGYYVQNLSGDVTALTIQYYDVNGNLTHQATETLDPLAARDIWMSDALAP